MPVDTSSFKEGMLHMLLLCGGGRGAFVLHLPTCLLQRKAPVTCHGRAFLFDFCFALLLCAERYRSCTRLCVPQREGHKGGVGTPVTPKRWGKIVLIGESGEVVPPSSHNCCFWRRGGGRGAVL